MVGRSLLPMILLCSTGAISASFIKPTVNLGYTIHEPSVVKTPLTSNTYYNFSNIRYAAPPLDTFRFTAPQPPVDHHSAGVQNGSYGHICPQGFPAWLGTALEINQVSYYDGVGAGQTESEDCLFLDVFVSQPVFQNRSKRLRPVLLWLYGGGFVNRDKASLTDPIGLLEAGEQDFIFVAPNYRLGAFGFLAGPDFQSQGGVPNAGLLDQKFALEWVQKYIHRFGGDKTKVTLMGESAGAGAILNHLTAPPTTSSLFHQVIAQSPVILPHVQATEMNSNFDHFLDSLNASSLSAARKISSEDLMAANRDLISSAVYGSYVVGPSIDHSYIPQLPNKLLPGGHYNISALISHTSHEGRLFVDHTITNETSLYDYLSTQLFPYLPQSALQHITSVLYLPKYDDSMPYHNIHNRLALLISEAFIDCSARVLAKALSQTSSSGKLFEYIFSVAPGLHGQDIAYSFFNPGGSSPNMQSKTAAKLMQKVLANFVRTGNPNGSIQGNSVVIPDYARGGMVLDIGGNKTRVVKDKSANQRCDWWGAESVMIGRLLGRKYTLAPCCYGMDFSKL